MPWTPKWTPTWTQTVERVLRLPLSTRRVIEKMLEHDCLNLSQSAAYSAMVALFPALIVAAATVALLPDANALKQEAAGFFDQVLPENVFPVLTAYFVNTGVDGQPHTTRALIVAALVSLIGGSGTIATLMEGLHRASGIPYGRWTFLQKRARALLLVPLSLLPLTLASVMVVFGRVIVEWIAEHLMVSVRPAFFGITLAIRWIIALAGVAAGTALIYHLGVPRSGEYAVRRSWLWALPGSVVATGMWFVSTLMFGWYVTRVANYSAVYGSLGAGIALLFWLFLVFLSVLCGAEFNEQIAR
jgi:membrane protein